MGGTRPGNVPSPRSHFTPLACVLALAACGYHMTASGGPLPKNVTAVYVPEFQNLSSEATLGGELTDAVRRRLDRQGIGGHADPSGTEGTLYGRIMSAGSAPVASKVYNSNLPLGQVTSPNAAGDPGLYVVNLTVSVKLMRGAELLTQLDDLALSEQYLPANDLATLEANRRNALERLVHDMAREIVERLTTGM